MGTEAGGQRPARDCQGLPGVSKGRRGMGWRPALPRPFAVFAPAGVRRRPGERRLSTVHRPCPVHLARSFPRNPWGKVGLAGGKSTGRWCITRGPGPLSGFLIPISEIPPMRTTPIVVGNGACRRGKQKAQPGLRLEVTPPERERHGVWFAGASGRDRGESRGNPDHWRSAVGSPLPARQPTVRIPLSLAGFASVADGLPEEAFPQVDLVDGFHGALLHPAVLPIRRTVLPVPYISISRASPQETPGRNSRGRCPQSRCHHSGLAAARPR